MATPKPQTKISYKKGKTEVTYESNLDASQYYLYELSRGALRDVGKFVAKKFLEAYYQHFEKHRGRGGKAVSFKVISGKSTTSPRVQIGLKAGKQNGFYGFYQEFGTSDGSVPRLGLLTRAVEDNVAEIVKIESQYLDGLNDEAARLEALVNENDYDGDADGDD